MTIKTAPLGELGANFYMITDEDTGEMLVIDPGAMPDTAISLIEDSGAMLKYIIITHAHTDHIGALDKVKGKFDAPVVIHRDDAAALNDPNLNLCGAFGFSSPVTHADIIVEDGTALPFGNTKIKFIHTPGHTRGSMCVLLDGSLFSGDTLFECSIGRTDFPGGSFAQIQQSIQNKIYTLNPSTVVYPGHGNPTTVEYEKNNNPFV